METTARPARNARPSRIASAADSLTVKLLDKPGSTPPVDVLAGPLTAAIVEAYPAYYILGPGHDQAAATDCGHGYALTDSCPVC
jgi:hypothetical protein